MVRTKSEILAEKNDDDAVVTLNDEDTLNDGVLIVGANSGALCEKRTIVPFDGYETSLLVVSSNGQIKTGPILNPNSFLKVNARGLLEFGGLN